MALPGNMVISEDALERLVQKHNIGEVHHILRPTALWRNEQETAELDRRINQDLANQPIYEKAGRLDRDFADSLSCLCRPEVAFVGMTHIKGRFRYLLACSLGREAILATRENGRVTLRQVDPGNLPGALVSALPDHPAAKFQPVSVPIGENEVDQGGIMRPSGGANQRSSERKMWDELAARPQMGGGQVVLELRDAMGRTKETDEPLCFVDMDLGGWYYVTENRGDRRYLFCAPASRQELTKQVHALHRQLVAA